VWSLAAPSKKVHINRILNAALPIWSLGSGRVGVSEETLRAELREGLVILEDAGDLVELSNGYWVPATSRFVELPGGTAYLLIGGVPSALLQIDQNVIQYHGPYRYLERLPVELAALFPIEAHESWARLPPGSLQEWAQDVFDSLDRQPYSPTNSESFEYYLPDSVRQGIPQFRRWSESAGHTNTTRLARRVRLYGTREYRLVDVRSGKIVSVCELQDIDVRRLMYALDQKAKNPVHARQLRLDHPPEWLFTSELPRAEQRTFAAFGTLLIPDDRPFERRWTFIRNEKHALDMLRSLGVVLEPKS
jgi:hypothetical protein